MEPCEHRVCVQINVRVLEDGRVRELNVHEHPDGRSLHQLVDDCADKMKSYLGE